MRFARSFVAALAFSLPLTACEITDNTGIGIDPDAPGNLTYQLIPSGQPGVPLGVMLAWDPPFSARANTYDVLGRSSGGADFVLRATTTSPSFHDAGQPQYQYFVIARDAQGNELGRTDVVTVSTASPLPAPAGLASISLNGAIQLRWASNAVDANRTMFDYYRVYSASYDASRNSCSQWALEGTTVSEGFLAAALTNGVSRCFAVSAVAVTGAESPWSSVRRDTPRFDAHNVLVYSHAARADSAGFLFYDETAHTYGVVTSAARSGVDVTVERHADGTLWFSPARSDVQMAVYGDAPVADLTSIDRASASALASITVEAVPGYGYVYSARKSDGTHYGAMRVAYVAPDYVVFDWSYQSAAGNAELSRGVTTGF